MPEYGAIACSQYGYTTCTIDSTCRIEVEIDHSLSNCDKCRSFFTLIMSEDGNRLTRTVTIRRVMAAITAILIQARIQNEDTRFRFVGLPGALPASEGESRSVISTSDLLSPACSGSGMCKTQLLATECVQIIYTETSAQHMVYHTLGAALFSPFNVP